MVTYCPVCGCKKYYLDDYCSFHMKEDSIDVPTSYPPDFGNYTVPRYKKSEDKKEEDKSHVE